MMNINHDMRPYEWDDNDVTTSDSFSDNAGDEFTNARNGSIGDHDSSLENKGAAEPTSLTSHTGAEITSSGAFGETLSQLSETVKRAISMVKTPLSIQDVKTFSRLSKYFTGDFHLEEIMYRENVRRTQLMLLLDKFREVLVTIEKEDSEINFFEVL